MITELGIANFKAFGEMQRVPIKPLTLIFGANGSGKSSILHSLLLAHHALAHGNVDVHEPRLAGQSVDLGGFREYVHGHKTSHGCALKFAFTHNCRGTTLLLEISRGPEAESAGGSSAAGVGTFELSLEDQHLLRAERGQARDLYVVILNLDHPVFAPFFQQIDAVRPPESPFRQPGHYPKASASPAELREMAEKLVDVLGDLKDEGLVTLEQDLLSAESRIRNDFPGQLRSRLLESVRQIPLRPRNLMPISGRYEGPVDRYSEDFKSEFSWRDPWHGLEGLKNPDFLEAVAEIFCFELEILLDRINAEFNHALESVKYLGPLRCYPPRHLVGMHDQDPNWLSGGGHAWDILGRDPEVRAKVNRWLTTAQGRDAGYELKVRNLVDLKRVSDSEKKGLAARLQEAGAPGEAGALSAVEGLLAELASARSASALGEVVLCDRRTGLEVSHRDVGVGISQLLPVLVHAYADQNQLVAIEQPEIHLHPALQAELGEVFIESALGERKNTFILETHSEHLILRIMRRIRETHAGTLPKGATPVRKQDVSILFVERHGSQSIVREMPLNEQGELVKAWPGGFFEESFRELFS